MYTYKKTKNAFNQVNLKYFSFRKNTYKKDSLSRVKHDFSNVLLSASLNQRSDDKKNSLWGICVYPDIQPIDITSFNIIVSELVEIISSYNNNNFYGIVEYIIQRTDTGYKIFNVSYR